MSNATHNDGGSAFPHEADYIRNNSGGYDFKVDHHPGMTLRDYFAGQALMGLLASGHFTCNDENGPWMSTYKAEFDEMGEKTGGWKYKFDFPEAAWMCADQMLKAREENK
jgi:hypothetical protein